MGHDLSFPFTMVKRGWKALYAPDARASEKMVPSIEGELARKRRMMSHGWPIVLKGGLLSPKGYGPLYALMIFSHRLLRYAMPFLHMLLLLANVVLVAGGAGWVYVAALAVQGVLVLGALLAPALPARPLLVARYYVLTQAALAAGLFDWLRHGTEAGWSPRGGHAVSGLASRALDLLIGGLGTILTAPLVALAALAIRLESPGHPIYRQRRVGRDGRPFDIYKLRTMVRGAEFTGAGLAIQEGDDRITRVGAVLRRVSLDELPNLWNVVRGEMAIVGPRPTVQVQVDQYTERQRGRLKVKPGITGWAQINGRASLPWSERIELDLWYVEHRSLALDLRILARTARLVLRGEGLYKGETGGWGR